MGAELITVASNAVGLILKLIKLKTAYTDYFKKKKEQQPLFDYYSKDMVVKELMEELYKLISLAEPIAKRAYKKILINYLLSVTLTILIFTLILLNFILKYLNLDSEYLITGAILFPLALFYIVPIPVKNIPKKIEELSNSFKTITNLQNLGKLSQSFSDHSVSNVQSYFGIIPRPNKREELFLKQFIELCAIRDIIEIKFLTPEFAKLQKKVFVQVTFIKAAIDNITPIISRLLESNESISGNRNSIISEIRHLGLSEFAEIISNDEGFWNINFHDEFKQGEEGLNTRLYNYWVYQKKLEKSELK